MIVKLMNSNNRTLGGTTWGENVTHAARNGKMELCSDTVIHFYSDPILAALMNPAHGNFFSPIARRFVPHGKIISDGTKSACQAGTTFETVELPTIPIEVKIHFAILCALAVYKEGSFVTWAHNWLNGTDRTKAAASYAADAALAAALAAAARHTARHTARRAGAPGFCLLAPDYDLAVARAAERATLRPVARYRLLVRSIAQRARRLELAQRAVEGSVHPVVQ